MEPGQDLAGGRGGGERHRAQRYQMRRMPVTPSGG
jgi:hypothetical protein